MRSACVFAVVALLVHPAFAGYRETVLADNPDAYWPFDEESGVTGVDLAAGNDATHRLPGEFGKKRVFKGTVTAGVPGAQFPGNDQFLPGEVNGFAVRYEGLHNGSDCQFLLPRTSEVTYEVSIKTIASGDEAQSIVGALAGGRNATGIHLHWVVNDDGSGGPGSVYFGVDNREEPSFGTSLTKPDDGAPMINDGEWHHIVGRWKGPSTEDAPAGFDIFIDGVKQTELGSRNNTGATAQPQETFFDGPVYFGVNLRSGTQPPDYYGGDIFQGDLDEISMYSTALSDDRVQAHWEAWSGIPEPSTLALLGAGGLLLLRRRRGG